MTAAKTTKKTLAEALIAFQADLPSVALDATNPHFKSKYASLGSVTKAVLPKLSEHGLAFSVGSFVDNGLLIVDAHLIHESGESRSLQFPITEANPQKIGSALSYARRYALSALTGVVADEDDDGNAASQPTATDQKIERARTAPAARPSGIASKDKIRTDWIEAGKVTKEDINARFEALKAQKIEGTAAFDQILSDLEAGK